MTTDRRDHRVEALRAEIADLRAQIESIGAGGVSGRLMGAVPGWKLVPIEPTQEMLRAAYTGRYSGGTEAVFKNMLSAAPLPPTEQRADHIPDAGKMVQTAQPADSLQVDAAWQSFGLTADYRRCLEWVKINEAQGALFIAFRSGLYASTQPQQSTPADEALGKLIFELDGQAAQPSEPAVSDALAIVEAELLRLKASFAGLSAIGVLRYAAKDMSITTQPQQSTPVQPAEPVKAELPEPVAHIYPSDLERFQESETFAHAYSVAVGNPDERSVPLYTLSQLVDYAATTQPQQSTPAVQPKIPPFIESMHSYKTVWTHLEAEQIEDYGRRCFAAGISAAQQPQQSAAMPEFEVVGWYEGSAMGMVCADHEVDQEMRDSWAPLVRLKDVAAAWPKGVV